MSLLGAVILGASASGGTGPATATTTAPDVRAQAQQILKSRASLLSAPVLTAMEMIARGDHSLSPSAATAPDAVQRHRSALKAAVQSTAAASDATSSLAAPANVAVSNPGEDMHQVEQTTQSETSLAVSGSHVAVGFNDSQNGLLFLTAGASLAGFAYSDNGGGSFTDGGSLPNVPGLVNIGDPWLATDPSGAMYYSNLAIDANSFAFDVVVSRSTDGGRHWATPTLASPAGVFGYQADKDALAAGVGPFHSGSALYDAWDDFTFSSAGQRSVHAATGSGGTPTPSPSGSPPPTGTPLPTDTPTPCAGGGGGGCGGPMTGLAVSHSYDRGKTWTLTYADRLPLSGTGCSFAQYIGAYPVVDNSSGTLYVTSERIDVVDPDCTGGRFIASERLFVSTDGGNTFSPGTVVSTINPVAAPFGLGPASAMRDLEFPAMALLNGSIYVAWNDAGTTGGGAQIRLARSSDGGTTWHTRFVTSGAGLRIQPALTADASGLHLLYYRINPSQRLDAVAADSPDGSQWTSRVLTSSSFPGVIDNLQFDPIIAPQYMGDYNAVVSDGTHRYYTWGDNRNTVTNFLWPQGRHDPDVFFAKT